MTTPLFDLHGITINDPADGYHTNAEINVHVQSIGAVPFGDRGAFFQAIRVHWDHQHFVTAPDNIYLEMRPDGSIRQKSIVFDYGGLTGHTGLEIPDSA